MYEITFRQVLFRIDKLYMQIPVASKMLPLVDQGVRYWTSFEQYHFSPLFKY